MVPLSQAIEVDSTRRLLQNELLDDAACPQVLVQVGWPPAASEELTATPRQPVDEVLGDLARCRRGSAPTSREPPSPTAMRMRGQGGVGSRPLHRHLEAEHGAARHRAMHRAQLPVFSLDSAVAA